MDTSNKELVFIIGGSGFIGQAVAKKLSDRFQVIALDLKEAKTKIPGVEFVQMDISKPDAVTKALNEVKNKYPYTVASVIHLAAFYSFDVEESESYQAITVEGTRNLLSELQNFESVEQFIFSSTMLVHEPSAKDTRVSESHPVNPQWAYPKSKVDAEKVIQEEHGKIPFIVLRIAGVYDDKGHSIPIANQIERVNEAHVTSHFFPGDTTEGRQAFIHLEDLVSAIDQAVLKRKELKDGLTLVLGEEEALSYQQMQDALGLLIHKKKWVTRWIPTGVAKMGAWVQGKLPFMEKPFIKPWMVDLADDNYELDVSLAKKTLDWEPKHSLKETLPLIIDFLKKDPKAFYREHKLSPPFPYLVNIRKHLPQVASASVMAMAVFSIFLIKAKR